MTDEPQAPSSFPNYQPPPQGHNPKQLLKIIKAHPRFKKLRVPKTPKHKRL